MRGKLSCALIITALMTTVIPTAFAVDTYQSSAKSDDGNSIIVPYADVIVTKTRIYNGKQQYRRWNETRGYWVDPYWIDL